MSLMPASDPWLPLWLAVAGAVGVLSRWGLGELAAGARAVSPMAATVGVNTLGCLAFGYVAAVLPAQHPLRVPLLVGLLGGFTTYATFAAQTHALLGQGRWGTAWVQLTTQCLLGVLAVWLGSRVACWLRV